MNTITSDEIREHIPEHLRELVHIDTRRSLTGIPDPDADATLVSVEVRFSVHTPILDETAANIPRDILLAVTASTLIRGLDQVIREWPGVTPPPEVVEIAPNVDDVVHALRRISGEVEHWATWLGRPDDAPDDEADPTPPHGTERRRICPNCGGSGTITRRLLGILDMTCDRCKGLGFLRDDDPGPPPGLPQPGTTEYGDAI